MFFIRCYWSAQVKEDRTQNWQCLSVQAVCLFFPPIHEEWYHFEVICLAPQHLVCNSKAPYYSCLGWRWCYVNMSIFIVFNAEIHEVHFYRWQSGWQFFLSLLFWWNKYADHLFITKEYFGFISELEVVRGISGLWSIYCLCFKREIYEYN